MYVCWGEEELRDEVTRVLLEIEDAEFGIDDIVILRIDESFNFKVKRTQRVIDETRKRIAADLHDELGADLHAIGLLSDLALSARAAPERLGDLLR
jgi:signal transduction histidine kinase